MSSHHHRRSRRLELVLGFLRRLRGRRRPLALAGVAIGGLILGWRLEP